MMMNKAKYRATINISDYKTNNAKKVVQKIQLKHNYILHLLLPYDQLNIHSCPNFLYSPNDYIEKINK